MVLFFLTDGDDTLKLIKEVAAGSCHPKYIALQKLLPGTKKELQLAKCSNLSKIITGHIITKSVFTLKYL